MSYTLICHYHMTIESQIFKSSSKVIDSNNFFPSEFVPGIPGAS